MRSPRTWLFVSVVLAAGAIAAQEQAVPQFRAGVEIVQLDVVVLDGDRQPVRGLTAADFTVLDNGASAPIRAFSAVEIPNRARAAEASWADEAPPDVVTNQAANQEGRLVVILLDRSIGPNEPTLAARRIAAAAVQSLGPQDLAAVVSTNNGAVRNSTVQNVTADRTLLLRAINAADPSTGISKEAEGVWRSVGLEPPDPLTDGRCLCGLCVLETMTRVADAVRGTPRRRKVLLFIGSNVVWEAIRSTALPRDDVGCEVLLKDARAALFEAVDRANLTVHAVDPEGLVSLGPQTRASTPGGRDTQARSAAAARVQSQIAETNDLLARQGNLRMLPERTGGRTVTGRNDPEAVVPDIFRESETYYLIGFERATPGGSDGTRSIEVKVARKGTRVHAQRQYRPRAANGTSLPAAPETEGSRPIQERLTDLLPSAVLPLALSVVPFAAPDDGTAVVRATVDSGAFVGAGGTAVPLDIVILAVDRTGMPVASARQTSTVTISGRTLDFAPEINVQTQLRLPRGDYGIRVAVSDASTGRTASVFSDITVPDFNHAPLSLSGVAVELSDGSRLPTPTTRRVFRRSDRVRAVVQIYQGTARTDALRPVVMRAEILDARGKAVRDQSLPFEIGAFTNRRASAVMNVPVAELPAGEYLLKLEATAGQTRSGRALRFTVR
jgi:VWFA-related protein